MWVSMALVVLLLVPNGSHQEIPSLDRLEHYSLKSLSTQGLKREGEGEQLGSSRHAT